MEQVSRMDAEQGFADVDAKVTVHAFEVDDDEIVFALGRVKGVGGGKPGTGVKSQGNTIVFDNVRGKISFKLKTHGVHLQFDHADPIWSCAGSDCPDAPGNVLSFTPCPDPHKELVVENNLPAGSYAYTLRFRDRDDNCIEFDPIIKNIA